MRHSRCSDRRFNRLNIETEKPRSIGQHADAISGLCHSSALKSVISASWDKTLRFWDPRAADAQQASYNLRERAYAIDIHENTLVVAMASRLFDIYDVRKMTSPAQTRESSLKFMTRSLACMADGRGLNLLTFGSIPC